MAALSLYIGFCTYMLTGQRLVYFWFVSAFVCILIAFTGGANSQNAFYTALLRVQETGLGILVYSLVSVLLWPQSSATKLKVISRKLFTAQLQLYRAYRSLMAGESADEDYRALRLQEIQLLSQFGQILNGAQTDTYEVWEVRRQWYRFHVQATNLIETLERWRESFGGIRQLNLDGLLPNLKPVFFEIDQRLAQVERMLNGKDPIQVPGQVPLIVNKEMENELNHFQKAAVALTKAQIDRLEDLSRSLFDCVQDITGFARHTGKHRPTEKRTIGLTLDPDRLAAALQVMITLWIAFFIWVYIDPPGHALFVFLTTVFALISVMMRLRVSMMFWPFFYDSAFAGILYVFVMPHLSGYAELGLLLFGVTFGYYYLFWQPQQALIKMTGVVCFLLHTSIQNQQSYSFAAYSNSVAMILLACTLAIAISYILSSPRPEKAFLRLLARFFRHSEFLMSRLALDRDEKKSLAIRWQMMFYRNDLLEIPAKLTIIGQRIDYHLMSGQTPEQVQALVTSLQALAYRIKELGDARKLPQPDLLVAAVLDDLRAWRLTAQKQLRRWADDPALAASQGAEMRDRLVARISGLEAKMSETLAGTQKEQVGEGESENFYRILGAFKGLSESGIEYSRIAESIDWVLWKEARF
ncbi:MAG: FUSC family protein [Deltaproteobacteria bacterium]|nr:FUSC family protein [Deltaproteobacteria bacterium]